MQLLDSCDLQLSKLLSWHCCWQSVFAAAVHEPLQSALHFVMQLAVVETVVHCVVQWSSQQALQDAWQSVDVETDTAPSDESDDEELEVHEELQPALHRVLQSVLQSNIGGLDAHIVEQSDEHDETQFASAVEVHMPSHCCSSLAAHALSQRGGAHCVEQSLCVTREHCAFASTSMFPQAATPAWATRGKKAVPMVSAAAATQKA
jgi:hypothetical protein